MSNKKLCLVALDIRSTHNVGAFLRTADGFGADVVLVGITPRPRGGLNDDRLPHIVEKMNGAIAKTALGAEESVDWSYFADIESAVTTLKNEGYHITAIEQNKRSVNIRNVSAAHTKHAVVVGPEVAGIPDDTLKLFDDIYEISMSGSKESFNVSIAAAIALYQLSNN
ncbi:MAG: 23S rRNA (guanosine2251-2'-O)-methyltransferase [Candidatus Saccharimonadales bacterium]|jgi:23S rRNA (guanosine2251-2'-O)-methyltransferase